MPKTKRDYLKRMVAQAHYHVDLSLERIQELHGLFEPVHPQYAELLELATMILMQGQNTLVEFSMHAWGCEEEELKTYRT